MQREESQCRFFLLARIDHSPQQRIAQTIARFQREEICQNVELSGLTELEVDELSQLQS